MANEHYSIGLVDCDSFFASCEQLYNPSLIGQPVCVMSNNDGCVVARSKEAKSVGVKMGMPVFQAKKMFPQVHYITGNLGRYGEISARVMQKLKDFTPTIEIYSIDEAFIDFTGLRQLYRKPYPAIAKDIRTSIKNDIGIPVSIGISNTKPLAKLATERAKGLNGIYYIHPRRINEELKNTNIIEIWGIGRNTDALLKKFGIITAYDFVIQNDSWIKKILGKKGLELKKELLGDCLSPVSDREVLPKSIQKTSSFAKFTDNPEYIKSSLHYHAHRACKKLRSLGLKSKTIGVMLRTKDFHVIYAKIALISPTDWEFEIYDAIDKLFEELYIKNVIYRSSGIILENLYEEVQLSLFGAPSQSEKHKKLALAWDKLENKYGKNTIIAGGFEYKK